jgi:hypothetical protein
MGNAPKDLKLLDWWGCRLWKFQASNHISHISNAPPFYILLPDLLTPYGISEPATSWKSNIKWPWPVYQTEKSSHLLPHQGAIFQQPDWGTNTREQAWSHKWCKGVVRLEQTSKLGVSWVFLGTFLQSTVQSPYALADRGSSQCFMIIPAILYNAMQAA